MLRLSQPLASSLQSKAGLTALTDRFALGSSGLQVSPVCLGMVAHPEIVSAAYRAGINFFFLSADMHWPLYEPLREGLRQLLRSSSQVREQIVVAVVSYVTQPEFSWAPFQEALQAVPELGHLDVAVIGGTYPTDFLVRREQYLAQRPGQMRALGATFHDRNTVVTAVNQGLVDVAFVRYNSAHDGAETDVFPRLHGDRVSKLFGFKSVTGYVGPERLTELGLPKDNWRPTPTDHYRFALRPPQVDGILCSFGAVEHVAALESALSRGSLSPEQAEYLKTLSALDAGAIELTLPTAQG